MPTYVPRPFGIKVRSEGCSMVLDVQGELDLATVPALAGAVDRAMAIGSVCLVLDLSELDFIDARGLGLLAVTAKRVGPFEVRQPGAMAIRLLEITGLDSMVRVTDFGWSSMTADLQSAADGDDIALARAFAGIVRALLAEETLPATLASAIGSDGSGGWRKSSS